MHLNAGFAFMTLKLDGFYQDFDRADTKDCSSQADKLVDQMRLDHGQWKHLVKVCEPDL